MVHLHITWLNENFQNKWIGRGGPVSWPPRSPDFSSCDFFLWGYLKQIFYCTPVESAGGKLGPSDPGTLGSDDPTFPSWPAHAEVCKHLMGSRKNPANSMTSMAGALVPRGLTF
ncbi:hypothetical protein WH47_02815 [Habropoda laboriosa]|uniref:Uncharacterized protein n=1 Tax=Habropoda laboriosa TaxID=597456 RepID=A0A0L7RH60_9HYME|nr:hypothetical protein WH47_02815 [Habropoda laboriosa]